MNAPPRRVLTFHIQQTWDGRALAPDEHTTVCARWFDDRLRVSVDAPFYGDSPPVGPVGPTDRLWEHEVVELFLVGREQRYLELEFGPHGHYLALELHGVRQVVRSAWRLPAFDAVIHGDRWTGEASVMLSDLPSPVTHANAFAIHGAGSSRRYLSAHRLESPQPDFHLIHAFPPVPR